MLQNFSKLIMLASISFLMDMKNTYVITNIHFTQNKFNYMNIFFKNQHDSCITISIKNNYQDKKKTSKIRMSVLSFNKDLNELKGILLVSKTFA